MRLVIRTCAPIFSNLTRRVQLCARASFVPASQHRRGPLAALQWHRQHLRAILFYAGLDRSPLGDKRMFAVPAERTTEAIGRYGVAPCKGTEP